MPIVLRKVLFFILNSATVTTKLNKIYAKESNLALLYVLLHYKLFKMAVVLLATIKLLQHP